MKMTEAEYSSYGTPCFLVYEKRVHDSVAVIREALSAHWRNSVLAFSVKTNSMPEVNRMLAADGVWAEVVSGFEFDNALGWGYAPGAFVCNGASKSPDYIRKAVESEAMLHLDSLSEVRSFFDIVRDRPCSFGVRINATEPDFDAEPSSGPAGSRFGLSVRDGDVRVLSEVLRQHPGARLNSLHLHCNTRSRGIKGYRWLTRFFCRIVKEYGFTDIDTFDVGGSFGHDFDNPGDGQGRWPSWNEYLSAIADELSVGGFSPDGLRLVIEPGASLISGCVEYLSRIVGERVFDGRRVLQMDGSRVHVDPHLARASFAGCLKPIRTSGEDNAVKAAYIGGSTCLEKDRIELGDDVGRMSVGDLLVFEKAGAYSYGLSPALFINPVPSVFIRR